MPPPSPRRSALGALCLPLLLSSACQYFKDRTADFLDQFDGVVGVGSVAGVRGRALGLIDTGLMMGVEPNAAALGWKYGSARYFHEADSRMDADEAEIVKVTSIVGLDYGAGSYYSARNSAAILPALLSWVDASPTGYDWHVPAAGGEFEDRLWIWDPASMQQNRYAQVHVFDVEAGAGLFAYLNLGYSPGELADFLLGVLTIDLAGDDGRW